MFKELQIVKDKISNAHMDWVDLKVNGALNEEAMAEIEKIDWPSFPVFSLEDYCKDYSDLAVHYYIQHEMVFISAIVYGDVAGEKDDPDNEFMFDLYDLHELNGDNDCLIVILKAKSLEDAKKETEDWIKGGFRKEISVERIDDIFPRYFDSSSYNEGGGEGKTGGSIFLKKAIDEMKDLTVSLKHDNPDVCEQIGTVIITLTQLLMVLNTRQKLTGNNREEQMKNKKEQLYPYDPSQAPLYSMGQFALENAHMSWLDPKVRGTVKEKAVADIEKMGWPEYAELAGIDYCYDCSVHPTDIDEKPSVVAIIFNIQLLSDGSLTPYWLDILDLPVLLECCRDESERGLVKLSATNLDEMKKETEEWVRHGLRDLLSTDIFGKYFQRYLGGCSKYYDKKKKEDKKKCLKKSKP